MQRAARARRVAGLVHETNSPTRDANNRTLGNSSLVMQDEACPRRKQPRSRHKVEARIRYKKAARARRAALSTHGYTTGNR